MKALGAQIDFYPNFQTGTGDGRISLETPFGSTRGISTFLQEKNSYSSSEKPSLAVFNLCLKTTNKKLL